MRVVQLLGGLGNQMFQYAFYKELTLRNPKEKVKLDISKLKSYKLHNGYQLNEIFEIDENIASNIQLIRFNNNKIIRLLKKYKFIKYKKYVQENFEYSDDVFSFTNTYYIGYWQSEKYFKSVINELISDFSFKNPLDKKNEAVLNEINSTESISVHIRRGDYYSNNKNKSLYGEICTEEYYLHAINYMTNKLANTKLFFFSDDIEWAKKRFNYDNSIFIDWNHGRNSYIDMQLMSCCKHNIIANSSFSWWGAYLNRNQNKLVVAPVKWFNDDTISFVDLLPNEWIKLDAVKGL